MLNLRVVTRVLAVAVVGLLGLTACNSHGSTEDVSVGDRPSLREPTYDPDARYRVLATVLDATGDHSMLCAGAIAESYPPQCSGPPIAGWDWDVDIDYEEASGVRWGFFVLVGSWDGEVFTLTEPARSPSEDDDWAGGPQYEFDTPCPPPEGGWVVVNAQRLGDEALQEVYAYASSKEEFGGLWLDRSLIEGSLSQPGVAEGSRGDSEPKDVNDVDSHPTDVQRAEFEAAMNDWSKIILNVSFTSDLAVHEEALREIWGGPLCVSQAAFSEISLMKIMEEVQGVIDEPLWASADASNNQVSVGILIDDRGYQEYFDALYGSNVVTVFPALQRM